MSPAVLLPLLRSGDGNRSESSRSEGLDGTRGLKAGNAGSTIRNRESVFLVNGISL